MSKYLAGEKNVKYVREQSQQKKQRFEDDKIDQINIKQTKQIKIDQYITHENKKIKGYSLQVFKIFLFVNTKDIQGFLPGTDVSITAGSI